MPLLEVYIIMTSKWHLSLLCKTVMFSLREEKKRNTTDNKMPIFFFLFLFVFSSCWISSDTHLLYIIHGPICAALLVGIFKIIIWFSYLFSGCSSGTYKVGKSLQLTCRGHSFTGFSLNTLGALDAPDT